MNGCPHSQRKEQLKVQVPVIRQAAVTGEGSGSPLLTTSQENPEPQLLSSSKEAQNSLVCPSLSSQAAWSLQVTLETAPEGTFQFFYL